MINIPIVSATVIVAGPFEFTFNLAGTASLTPTPAEANPNIFFPAPTPTPISLEDYQYTQSSINTGDLLFAVLDGDKTNIFVFTPHVDQQPRLLATLPGAVAQLYMHPDRLGMDYLAGVQKSRDGIFYIDKISLYTVRFSEPVPQLLYTFAPNPENTVGTIVQADWSFDGRYIVFESGSNPQPGGSTQLGWFDMACRANKKCVPHAISIKQNLGFGNSSFAPGDYRILLSGADASGTGRPDLFLWNFDPGHPDNPIINITTNLLISDSTVTKATWTSDGKIFDLCWDTTASQNNVFCLIDPETGSIRYSEPVYPNLNGYRLYDGNWLALYGKLITAIIFPENATRDSMPELRLLDWNGHPQALLAKSQSINAVSFSPFGQFIAYSIEEERQLEIFDTLTHTHIPIYNGNTPWILTWLAWVH